MIRRDWFEQRIEILSQAIAAALGLKAKGDVQAAIVNMENAFTKAFGMNVELALGFPFDQFLSFACRGEKPTPELLEAMAKTFAAWSDVLKAAGRDADAALAHERSQECLRGAR
jgi:hypothetical protein